MIPINYIVTLLVTGAYILYWAWAFIIFYHLTRFGIGTQPKRMAAIFFMGGIVLFLISVLSFAKIDLTPLTTTFS